MISNGRREPRTIKLTRLCLHRERIGRHVGVSCSDRLLSREFHLVFSRQCCTGGVDVRSFSCERDSVLRRRNHSVFDRQITQTRSCRESTRGEYSIGKRHRVSRLNRGLISNGRREPRTIKLTRLCLHRERIGRHVGVSCSDRLLSREFHLVFSRQCCTGGVDVRSFSCERDSVLRRRNHSVFDRQITQTRGCRESTCTEFGAVERHGVARHDRSPFSNGRCEAGGFNVACLGRHRERSGLNKSVSRSDRLLSRDFSGARNIELRRLQRQITQVRGCRESTCTELGAVERHGLARHNRSLISNGRREASGFNAACTGRHRERIGLNGSFSRSDRLLSREFSGTGNVELRRLQRQITRIRGCRECPCTELGAVERHGLTRNNRSPFSNGRRETRAIKLARLGRHCERIGRHVGVGCSDRLLRRECQLVFSRQFCTGGVDVRSFSCECDFAILRCNHSVLDRQFPLLRRCRKSTCSEVGIVKRHRVARLHRSLISNSRCETRTIKLARLSRHRERIGLNGSFSRSDRLLRGEFHLVFSRQCCSGDVDIGSFSRECEGTFGRVDSSSECGKPLRGNCAHCTAREICAVKHQILTSRERGRSRNLALQPGSGEVLRRSYRKRSGLNGGIRDLDIFICRDRNRLGCQERGFLRDNPCETVELNLARCGLDRRIGEVKRLLRRDLHVVRGFNRGAARERDAAAHSGDECPRASLGLEPCRIDAAACGADFNPAARTEVALSRGDRFTKERCITCSLNNAARELQLARLGVELHAALGADGRVVCKLDPGLFRRHGEVLILTRRLQIARKRDLIHGVELN